MAETRDLPVAAPLIAMAATALAVALGALVVWRLMHGVWAPEVPVPPRFADDTATVDRGPSLDPLLDWDALEARARERLEGIGWVDRATGVVHVPIDHAMTLLLERGLPAQDREEPAP